MLGLALTQQAAIEAKQRLLELADRQFQLHQVIGGEQVLHIAQGHLHRALLALGAIGPKLQGGIAEPALRLGHQGLGSVATVNL